ncbi:M15 family metallopeptidase [Aristaeella lactis]|uniref:D-alanyl-D-alanine carboxypeptidase n=1 Tax=Aristaeella lactis TaxID=3046383 RepID=A0AC61PKY4_9FIRM|nr:D-alanyl-D-alanine carboxypeptidase family protein [Aristaeella lactis]QUA52108.1 D-alanyl-D-alanine carboxypeptidase family protein [Aristaeella lactis]SMC57744.1 D-alanyl-D-alanine carboxypeptidase [Aristaeella lactis]
MSRAKKSKAVPIVLVITILLAVLAVVCFLINPLVIQPKKDAIDKAYEDAKAAVEEHNKQIDIEYQLQLSEAQAAYNNPENPSWPENDDKLEWEVLDLSQYPLQDQRAVHSNRQEIMYNGMLLVNAWHSRPTDYSDAGIVGVSKAYKGEEKIQAKDNNVTLHTNALAALHEALLAAKAEGMEHYLVEEGYRTIERQQEYYNKKREKLSSKYSGEALDEATKKEVNYPGTSEYNSGLAFELRLYDKNDPDVGSPKYSTTPEGKWMNENCWKYGLVFRFPQNQWPLETSTDKSFKTGVSVHLNVYRYVGKGNAAIMHYMDFTMEEYIEYLEEHPHIALYVDDHLQYEVYRQIVGDDEEFDIQLNSTNNWESSLDNMGGIITVFDYTHV